MKKIHQSTESKNFDLTCKVQNNANWVYEVLKSLICKVFIMFRWNLILTFQFHGKDVFFIIHTYFNKRKNSTTEKVSTYSLIWLRLNFCCWKRVTDLYNGFKLIHKILLLASVKCQNKLFCALTYLKYLIQIPTDSTCQPSRC